MSTLPIPGAHAYPNHDPGHYLDSHCTTLVAFYESGSNWAYFACFDESSPFYGQVQARAVVAGCRSSSFGAADHLRHIYSTRADMRLTRAGQQLLYPNHPHFNPHDS